jgi:hypothetical protein
MSIKFLEKIIVEETPKRRRMKLRKLQWPFSQWSMRAKKIPQQGKGS